MGKFLAAALSAIKTALRYILKATATGLQLVAAPIEWIGNMFSGGGYDLPTPEEEAAEHAPSRYTAEYVMTHPEVQEAITQEPLALIFAYLRTAPEEREKVSLRPLDLSTQAWVRTLPDEEAKLLLKAGMRATVNHAKGLYQVPGVRFPLAIQQQIDREKAAAVSAPVAQEQPKPRLGYTKDSPYVLKPLPPKPVIDPQFRQFRQPEAAYQS